jgi:hypothetical protein
MAIEKAKQKKKKKKKKTRLRKIGQVIEPNKVIRPVNQTLGNPKPQT